MSNFIHIIKLEYIIHMCTFSTHSIMPPTTITKMQRQRDHSSESGARLLTHLLVHYVFMQSHALFAPFGLGHVLRTSSDCLFEEGECYARRRLVSLLSLSLYRALLSSIAWVLFFSLSFLKTITGGCFRISCYMHVHRS